MIRKFGGKQLREVTNTDNTRKVLVSYNTPVAVVVGDQLFVTEQKFSVTTSKHISFYTSKCLPKEVVHISKVSQDMIYTLARACYS